MTVMVTAVTVKTVTLMTESCNGKNSNGYNINYNGNGNDNNSNKASTGNNNSSNNSNTNIVSRIITTNNYSKS